MAHEINLYKAYIRAWSYGETERFKSGLEKYFRNMLDFSELWDIRHFDTYFSIERGEDYNVNEDYVIIYWGKNQVIEKIVWKGDYPTEEAIKECLEVLD